MRVIDPGHQYELDVLDGDTSKTNNVLTFVKREGPGYPGNVGHYPGTNCQEVLRALINRVKYLDGQIRDHRNDDILHYLREAIQSFEERAAERHGRNPNAIVWWEEIENMPTCQKCGHIGCTGNCHP